MAQYRFLRHAIACQKRGIVAATLRTGRKSQCSCEQKETIKSEPRKTSGEKKCIKQLYIGRARFQIKSLQPSRRIVRQPAVAHNSKTKGGRTQPQRLYLYSSREGGRWGTGHFHNKTSNVRNAKAKQKQEPARILCKTRQHICILTQADVNDCQRDEISCTPEVKGGKKKGIGEACQVQLPQGRVVVQISFYFSSPLRIKRK